MKATIILQRIKQSLPPSLLKEALFSFSFDIFGILAGFIFASYLNVFQLSTWVIALYPSVLTGRGVINGVLSGRLSTALHLGTIKPALLHSVKFNKIYKKVKK